MIDPFALDEAPLGEPLSLVVGHSAQWRREINVDNALFELRYDLREYEPSGTPVDYSIPMVPLTAGEYGVDIIPPEIDGWVNGRYFWDLVLVRSSDDRAKVIETGEIRIFDDQTDRRSHAEVMIAKIEGVLQGRADNDVESYTIKSRSITKMSAKELRDWRDYYVREIKNQVSEKGLFEVGGPNKNTLKVRFRD